MKTGTGYFSALTPPMRRNIAWWKSCLSPFLIFAFLLSAFAGTPKPPDWVIGTKAAGYPVEQFLIGVGQADSRSAAEERAYAADSRIFTSAVTSRPQLWPSYMCWEQDEA